MAQFPCPECEAEIGPNASRCKSCGWEARRPAPSSPLAGSSQPGRHDSNPNDPICQSCGSPSASIFPGVLRGGGKGYCSDCYRRMKAGGFTGPTEEGSAFSGDIKDLLKASEARIRAAGRR